ncbi:sodium-independent sulfate anion transporter-like [Cloeon dipterum]|uniref:sodium-independent sulfate anion transporter-like n=1 Tax=Cloeon dipterum TaxID=197152 RepID=UPI00321FE273
MELYDFKSDERPLKAREWLKGKGHSLSTKKFWLRRFPIVGWLQSYTLSIASHDLLAGVTVGLVELPKCLAAAILAGLPPQYGLYSSLIGYFVYPLLGTCKFLNFGPTLVISMLMSTYTDKYGPDGVVLIAFLAGVMITILALLQLAPLVEFISYPVTSGFMSAGVITIVLGQLVAMVGIKGSTVNVIKAIETFIIGIDQFNMWDLVMGLVCAVILLGIWHLGEITEKAINRTKEPTGRQLFLRYFSMARNAIVLIASIVFVVIMITTTGQSPVGTPEQIEEGFPPIRPPTFQLQIGDETLSFAQTLSELSAPLFVVPLILLLEFVSVAKSFAGGKTIDTTQELLALGLTNILGSFVQSIPVSASFVRSAVNVASGVKTPISNLYTGGIMLAVLGVLAQYLSYIPTSTLAAVIITSLLPLFKIPQVTMACFRSSKRDLIPMYTTFFVGLFVNLTFAILFGVLVDLVFILYPTARPKLIIKSCKFPDIGEALLVVPDKNLSYSNIEFTKQHIIKSAGVTKSDMIVVDGSFVHVLDTTSIKALKETVGFFQSSQKKILFMSWRNHVRDQFVNFDDNHSDLFIPSVSFTDKYDVHLEDQNSLQDIY